MLVLGLDVSTEIAAIGLIAENEHIGEINISLHQQHSERLLPIIDFLLKETGINKNKLAGLAVTVGPGSFTGLRIGLTTIKTMAQFLKIPVVGLSTLEVIAANMYQNQGWLLPVQDARHSRVYNALFKGGSFDLKDCRQQPDQVLTLEDLIDHLKEFDPDGEYYLAGSGVTAYRKIFEESDLNFRLPVMTVNQPRGAVAAELGRFYLQQGIRDDYRKLSPEYLKNTYFR